MKNEAGVGIVRGPSTQSKEHTVHCPFPCCKWTMKLKRLEKATISSLLNVEDANWEYWENGLSDGQGGVCAWKSWEHEFEKHVDTHSVADIVADFQYQEDRIAMLDHSMRDLNDFLDQLEQWLTSHPAMERDFKAMLKLFVKSNEMIGHELPDQLRQFAVKESS